jgi:hypothetical protein
MCKAGVFAFGRITKPGGKRGKLAFGFLSFPRFPRGVISTALCLSPFSERSDAEVAFIAAEVLSWLLFSLLARIRSFLTKILRQDGRGATISRPLD